MKFTEIFGPTTEINFNEIKPPIIKKLDRSKKLLSIISDMHSSGENELCKKAIDELIDELRVFNDELTKK